MKVQRMAETMKCTEVNEKEILLTISAVIRRVIEFASKIS